MTALSIETLDAARRDPVVFARDLLGHPLFEHQVDVVRSPARYRVLCAGRRAGKTYVFAVLALHRMFSVPGSRVMIVSAGETAVKRTHREITAMVTGAVGTASSVEEENVLTLTLSNGSRLESVPSSIKAARSADVDLLIVDEAGFVDDEVWEAAEPTIGARPGARVLVASSPWGGPGRFFHDLWQHGMKRPDTEVRSWHWPSTINPLVDQVWLEGVRERSASDYFDREYLAEWTAAAGSYFSENEVMSCVADYELLDPQSQRVRGLRGRLPAAMGVDWGVARDANAVALLSVLDDEGAGDGAGRLFVPWLEARYRWQWSEFIDHLVSLAGVFDVEVVASETNGVGAYPTADLQTRLQAAGLWVPVDPVVTTARRKQTGFGTLKGLMQRRQIVLPRHPELLKQLVALEFEQLTSGLMRIAVPERSGHDDLALSLVQALSCVRTDMLPPALPRPPRATETVETSGGVVLPLAPVPWWGVGVFARPESGDGGDRW